MHLLFDIGNTRVKWALIEGSGFSSRDAAQADQFDAQDSLQPLLAHASYVKSVWVSCVGSHDVLNNIQTWVDSNLTAPFNIFKVSAAAGEFKNAYKDIKKLGVDRWAAAWGARALVPEGHIIIVDAGTTVTIDWLDANNVFQGGAIVPGATLMHDSLVDQTVGIQSVLVDAAPLVGRTTQDCVNSGVHFGLVGAVRNIIQEMQRKIHVSHLDHPHLHYEAEDAVIVLTGGDSKILSTTLGLKLRVDKNLVLRGLGIMALNPRTEGSETKYSETLISEESISEKLSSET